MKRALIILLLITSACHKIDPKQQHAQKLVKDYMSNHYAGPNGYEGVIFSGIHSLHSSYFKTKAGMALDAIIKLEADSINQFEKQRESLSKNSKVNRDKIRVLIQKELPLQKKWVNDMLKVGALAGKYKGQFEGYKLSYTFKVKNNLSLFIYHKTIFHTDTAISKITFVKDTIIDAVDINW